MYPKERWEDAGKPNFRDFGRSTDGGCPWTEWYDEDKILNLVGEEFKLIDVISITNNVIEALNCDTEQKERLKTFIFLLGSLLEPDLAGIIQRFFMINLQKNQKTLCLMLAPF